MRAAADPRVWLLIAVYFTVALADNAFGFYRRSSWKTALRVERGIGLLAAVPSAAGVVGMVASA